MLDSLEPQVHRDSAGDFPTASKFIHGNVARPRSRRGTRRRRSVVHLAAAVGVGQSMYEIERYVASTRSQPHVPRAVVAMEPRPARLVVASSMSIYGEGEYVCPDHGAVAPLPRPEEQLLERRWECLCPVCGTELTPIPTRETKSLYPDVGVRGDQARPRRALLGRRGRLRCAYRRLRFFNVYGSGQALSNPYTGVAAIFSSRLLNGRPPLDLRGWACSHATSST